MSWTQPVCLGCYRKRFQREPVAAFKPEFAEIETCCLCGHVTKEGIYARIDPQTVPFPRKDT